ncbi:MAG: hypothetical protein ACE5HI_08860 [bacterium]
MSKEKFLSPIPRESPKGLSRIEKSALELLQARRKAVEVNMADFIGVPGYGKEQIEHHRNNIKKKLAQKERLGLLPLEQSYLLEGLMVDQIELSNWFGENAFTIATSEYDDVFNGADLAVVIKDGETTERATIISIDITSSAPTISKKLGVIKQGIRTGQLSSISYFHSEDYDPNFYGPKHEIPQVVLGVGRKTINELAELWMSAYGLSRLRGAEENKKLSPEAREGLRKRAKVAIDKFARHRAQILLLEEIKIQLDAFHKFAEQVNQGQAAEKLAAALDSIISILQSKRAVEIDNELLNSRDPVFLALQDAVKNFEKL